eukprot:5513198-Amphidinium_carterae.1
MMVLINDMARVTLDLFPEVCHLHRGTFHYLPNLAEASIVREQSSQTTQCTKGLKPPQKGKHYNSPLSGECS